MSAPKYGSRLDQIESFPASATLELPRRGPPGESHELGFLFRQTSTKQFRVFGNESIRRYYVVTPAGARVQLCTSPHLPLYDGDRVRVPGEQGMWVFRQHGVQWR